MSIQFCVRAGVTIIAGAGWVGCGSGEAQRGDDSSVPTRQVDSIPMNPVITESMPAPAVGPPAVLVAPRGVPDFGLEVAEQPSRLRSVPITGGTLAISADKTLAAAADPDRDKVYIVDLVSEQLRFSVPLQLGAEPGRLAFDNEGAVHVATRRGGQLISIDAASGELIATREVCAAPRGVAFDEAKQQLHVACQTGELVSFPLHGAGEPRRLDLGRDLRDVVVVGDQLRVSRFKTAEVLSIDAAGTILNTNMPAGAQRARFSTITGEPKESTFVPNVAWRMVSVANGEALVVHQESLTDEIELSADAGGGYSGFGCAGGIVVGAVSVLKNGQLARVKTLGGLSHTDIAVSDRGAFAAVAAGESLSPTLGGNVFFGQLEKAPVEAGPLGAPAAGIPDGISLLVAPTPAAAGMDGPGVAVSADNCPHQAVYVDSEVTSVGFAQDGLIVVQSREPARLTLIDPLSRVQSHIELDAESRLNTASRLFHGNTGQGISCASCHPEGAEDGHVWSFQGVGARRTQDIGGGILSTLPLHWDGEFSSFDGLVQEVMMKRMGGRPLNPAQIEALGSWIDQLPAPAAKQLAAETLSSGRAAFNKAKCDTCHAGELLTNNQSYNVGTGVVLQTPSLKGIGARAPFMHSGCAKTLLERFDPACGGAQHGEFDSLSEPERGALIDYLETL